MKTFVAKPLEVKRDWFVIDYRRLHHYHQCC